MRRPGRKLFAWFLLAAAGLPVLVGAGMPGAGRAPVVSGAGGNRIHAAALADPCDGMILCGGAGDEWPGHAHFPHCEFEDCGDITWYTKGLSPEIGTLYFDPPVTRGIEPVEITLVINRAAPAGSYAFEFGAACNGCASSKLFVDVYNRQLETRRRQLMTMVTTGVPVSLSAQRGHRSEFQYERRVVAGSHVATLEPDWPDTPTRNPNRAHLVNPVNPQGPPSPGGLAEFTLRYGIGDRRAVETLRVPTFGMSCYYTAYEGDWGTPPNACRAVRIHGVRYEGAVTNPYGLAGTYCNSFVGQVVLQGSGGLLDGRKVQYDAGAITVRESVTGADNTPVIPDGSVARDRSIIPRGGVLVDVDQVGTGLLANDTGGAIRGYRLDYYRGFG